MSDQITDDRRVPGYSRRRGSRAETIAMAVILVIGIIGLAWLGTTVGGGDRRHAGEPRRDDTELVRSEVERIFVPAAFVDLAKDPASSAALQSYESIERYLREHGLEKTWYAITFRGIQSNGQTKMLTTHCCPFQDSSKALEFRYVVETLAGKPPSTETIDYSTAEITLMPNHLAAKGPGGSIDELMLMPR